MMGRRHNRKTVISLIFASIKKQHKEITGFKDLLQMYFMMRFAQRQMASRLERVNIT